ncbi:TniB family NTP-binding protein [Amphritea balenae]|nr:TniB family NTP-binding protein [Amphritea balenae]GGK80577.1 hypothetical protein GCM10007941_33670 [Amphritea balenae]
MNNVNNRKPETLEFESKIIKHPLFKQAYQVIEQVQGSYQPLSSPPGLVTSIIGGAEPEGAVLLGNTGSGKSTLLKYFIRKNFVEGNDESDRLRVFYVEVPHKATTKKLTTQMLRLLNSPRWMSGTEQVQLIELKQLLWELGVELIIFDEINNLLPKNAGNSTVGICDFFKSLMNQTKIPLILSGTMDSEKVILSNEELADRLNAVQYLHYFSLAAKNAQHDHFRDYMGSIAKSIPIECIDLTDEEMLKRFYIASSGIPRRISRIVSETLQYADLSSPLSMADFSKGYQKALRRRAVLPNPFDPSYTANDLLVIHADKVKK